MCPQLFRCGFGFYIFLFTIGVMTNLQCIGNSIGRYVYRVGPKENIFPCARICVEVDIEKQIPEVVVITLDNWQHVQQFDYEQLPYKYNIYHEYKHFVRNCKKVDLTSTGPKKEDQWKEVSHKFFHGGNMVFPHQQAPQMQVRNHPPKPPKTLGKLCLLLLITYLNPCLSWWTLRWS
jgi:hypothetical protein